MRQRIDSAIHFGFAFLLFGTPGVILVVLNILHDGDSELWLISLLALASGVLVSCAAAYFKERFWSFLKMLFHRKTLLDSFFGD